VHNGHEGRRRLADRYELAGVIGRGGMGTVYRATDLVLDRTVAVKVLPAELAEGDASHVERFQREARAAASLAHPGVVAVYDTGEDDATRFIVMECVNGRSLSELLREDAPLDPERAVGIAAHVADALAAAHAAGIVHRDIKPGNVMIADDGAVKVLDFGLARARDATALTQSMTVLGTAGSPEQALGKRADERSDVYSLGCLLYALLTGRPPFTGESAAAILNQHVNGRPRPPSALNRRIPPALDAIVLQMLSKSPAARPQSATEVRERLSEALTQDTAPTRRMNGATRGPPTAITRVLAAGAHRDRSRRAAAAVALAAAALLALLIVALASGGGAPSHHLENNAASKPAATRSPAASPSRSTSQATAAQAPAVQAAAPAPTTVAGALGALSSLLAQDAQAGTIDPQAARQLSQGLGQILTAYDSGHAREAEKGLTELSKNLAQLQNQGRITPAAAGPLDSALASLSGALPQNAPQAGQQDGGELPGQGARPPGQAKKQGDRGSGGGD
jgi:eukaryotic-like serine/threonine-protein kinase